MYSSAIAAVIADGGGQDRDQPGLGREGEQVMAQPSGAQHDERQKKAADREKAEERGREGIKVRGEHGVSSAACRRSPGSRA